MNLAINDLTFINGITLLLGDNTDFQEDIFIIHLDYPRFINLKDDEVEFIEEARS
jgi:hypothetical protein